ncbi:DNA pilot protein [Apis mellifera associated microvirus 28]|nr:DNA pilot protein [Apis mellifera associated microvirus 28]
MFGSIGKAFGDTVSLFTGKSTLDALAGGNALDLIPGIGDARAQDSANKQNLKLDQMNRQWMENMSNSAYQRAMTDMKKAGLNPMLAYQQGGASVPNTAAPQLGAASKTRLADAGLQAFTGISAARTQQQQAQTAQAQVESSTKLQTAQTAKEVAQTRQTMVDTKLKERELKSRGIKDTVDREGGRIIQKLFDTFNTNTSKPHPAKEWLKNNKPKVLEIIEKPGYKLPGKG